MANQTVRPKGQRVERDQQPWTVSGKNHRKPTGPGEDLKDSLTRQNIAADQPAKGFANNSTRATTRP